MRLNIIFSATGLIAGATASALTYTAMATATTATATGLQIGTNIAAIGVGVGVRVLLGETTERIVNTSIQTFGSGVVVPSVRASGNTLAVVTSAAVGAIVVAAVSLLGYGTTFAFKSATQLLKTKQVPIPFVISDVIHDQTIDALIVHTLEPDPV
jgi:hypothetical protein